MPDEFQELRGAEARLFVQKEVDELAALYLASQTRIVRMVMSQALTDIQNWRYEQVLAQIRAEIRGLNAIAKAWSKKIVPDAYRRGSMATAQTMAGYGLKLREVNLGSVMNSRAVRALVDQTTADLVQANTGMQTQLTRYIRATQQRVVEDRMLSQAIAAGLSTGESGRTINRAVESTLRNAMRDEQFIVINGRHYTPEYYARLVARTRTREAASRGVVMMNLEYRNDLVQTDIHVDACPICRLHMGRVYSISGTHPDFPPLETRAPWHPHCVLPETPVFAPGTRAAFVAPYNGLVFDVCLSNSARFSVTPNHMFLTPSGFFPAGSLRQGDNILCSADFERVVLNNPHNNRRVPSVYEVIQALSGSSGVSTARVPVSPEYLHGDARGVDGYIDIVGANRFLRSNGQSGVDFGDHGVEFCFQPAAGAPFSFACCRDTALMLEALRDATDGGRPELRISLALFRAKLRRGKQVGLAETPNGYTPSFEAANYGLSGDAERLSNAIGGLAGQITLAHVVSVQVRHYTGHVYDLQTNSSLYICNGAVSSNCRCNMVPVIEGIMKSRGTYNALSYLSKNSPHFRSEKEANKWLASNPEYNLDGIHDLKLFVSAHGMSTRT